MSIDYRETLVTYLRADSTRDCAKTLGISVQALQYRLKLLKQAGVKVPRKGRARGKISALEVSQLNSLISKHLKEESQIR
jgi:predicted transcriptional regulator